MIHIASHSDLAFVQVKAGMAPIAEWAGCDQIPIREGTAMTTLAILPRPLERLFDRIDAAEPTDAYFRALLDVWRAQRLQRFLPTRAALAAPEPIGGHGFSFVLAGPPTGDWALDSAGDVAALLGLKSGSWFPDTACSAIIGADVGNHLEHVG